MSSDIENKLDKVKETYQDEGDKEVIDSWEKRITRMALMKDYQQHDITKEIVKEAKQRIISINYQLSENGKLSSEERGDLFCSKKVYQWFLGLLAINPEEELKNIELELNKALEITN